MFCRHEFASNTTNFQTVVKSFTGLNCLYELKGDLSPVMRKEIFHDSFKNFKITRICVENHASVTGWQKLLYLIQILPTFGGHCNRDFWDLRLKILRLPYFNILFECANKIFQKWTVFVFTESWSRDQVLQRAHSAPPFWKVLKNKSYHNIDIDILIFHYMEKSNTACRHEVSLTWVKSHPC